MSLVTQLEQQLISAKERKELRRMAVKLSDNYEFRTLILEGFCEANAARCVRMSVDTNTTPEIRADALGMGQAAGYLQRHLSAIVQAGGDVTDREILDLEDALAEARAEEDIVE